MRLVNVLMIAFLVPWLCGQQTGSADKDQASDISEVSMDDLLNISVVSASKNEQKLYDASAKIVVVTADQIRKRGYLDLEQVLHDLAGFDFNKTMSIEWSTIFMRGLRTDNSDRFLLIWDGVIQNDLWKQSVWLSRQYPLTNIERIEVMYGPSSLLYGANAFSGIINVILKKEKDVNGINFLATGGSFKTGLVEVNAGKEWNGWRFMMNYRMFQSNEMDLEGKSWTDNAGNERNYVLTDDDFVPASDPKYALDVRDGVVFWDPGDHNKYPLPLAPEHHTKDWFLQLGVGYKGFEFRYFRWERDENGDLMYTPQKRINTVWTPDASAAYGSYTHQFTEHLSSKSYVIYRTSGLIGDRSNDPSFKAYFTGDDSNPMDRKIYKLGFNGFYRLHNVEWKLGEQVNASVWKADVVGGVEYTMTKNYEDYCVKRYLDSDYVMTPQHDERNLGLYVNADIRLHEMFTLTAGTRFDHNYVKNEEGGFGNLFTSRIAGVFKPSKKHYLKLIYGQAFQAPDAWRKFSTVPGERPFASPDLKPEKLRSVEFCYVFLPLDKWEHNLSVFRNNVEDLISTVNYEYQGAVITKFANVGKVKIWGVEYETRYFLDKEKSFYFNLTWNSAKDGTTDRKTGDIAPYKANFGADLTFRQRYCLSVRAHAVSECKTINWDSASIYVVDKVPGYLTADVTFSVLNVWKGLDLRAAIYNVTDKKYYNPGVRTANGIGYNSMVIQEPFRIFVSLNYKF